LTALDALLRFEENKAIQNAQSSSSGYFRIPQTINSKNTHKVHTPFSRNTLGAKQKEATVNSK